jgi:tetratricopeptide (TPR) repeat protein
MDLRRSALLMSVALCVLCPRNTLAQKPYDPNVRMMPEPIPTHEEQCRRAQQRNAEKVKRLQEQMREPNSPEELATLKHELAKTYELMPGKGQDARETYAGILENHPGYSKCYEVAFRLAELYNYVTLPGTKEDPDKAVAYYEQAIAICPPGRPLLQQAHLSLGIVLWHKGDKAGARKQLEQAYRFDPSALVVDTDGDTPRQKEDRIRVARSRAEMIRGDALGLFVAAHRDASDPVKTFEALGELERRYAADARVLEIIRKERNMTLKRGQQFLPQLNSLMSFPGGTRPDESAPPR